MADKYYEISVPIKTSTGVTLATSVCFIELHLNGILIDGKVNIDYGLWETKADKDNNLDAMFALVNDVKIDGIDQYQLSESQLANFGITNYFNVVIEILEDVFQLPEGSITAKDA